MLVRRHVLRVEEFGGVLRVGAQHGGEEDHARAEAPQQVRQVDRPHAAGRSGAIIQKWLIRRRKGNKGHYHVNEGNLSMNEGHLRVIEGHMRVVGGHMRVETQQMQHRAQGCRSTWLRITVWICNRGCENAPKEGKWSE